MRTRYACHDHAERAGAFASKLCSYILIST